METFDLAMLALRIWLAAVMVAHGLNHGRNLDGTASWFASKGFANSRVLAVLSSAGEVAIGLGLALGLATPLAAAGLIAVMTTAFWSIHRFAGFFVFARPDEGYEYVVSLAVAAALLATVGPGEASLDAVVGLDLAGGWGALIALGGVLAAGAQLAVLWRKPEERSADVT